MPQVPPAFYPNTTSTGETVGLLSCCALVGQPWPYPVGNQQKECDDSAVLVLFEAHKT